MVQILVAIKILFIQFIQFDVCYLVLFACEASKHTNNHQVTHIELNEYILMATTPGNTHNAHIQTHTGTHRYVQASNQASK